MRREQDSGMSLVGWLSVCAAFAIFVLNFLYRASSRNNVPMFSQEAFSLAMPYWLGAALGLLALVGYWLFIRKRGNTQ